MEESFEDFSVIPQDARAATKHVLNLLLDKIQPLTLRLRRKLLPNESNEEAISKVRDVYTLCSSQINKCLINLFDVFKVEFRNHTLLQESRQYNLERLSWCINRLLSIENYLERSLASDDVDESGNDSFNITTMHFVNWIDHTFEVLGKLADAIYRTDHKESEVLYNQWKNYMVECVSELHVSIDELLLSAMTLCRYCLADDQHIVKARCQVVLRETKALLSELIEGDLSSTVRATPETLKLPIMPSNANVLIDVLKDVLYALETNTNTALLALVGYCFTYDKSPIAILRDHFNNGTKGTCSCLVKSEDEVTENCSFVKDFDLYNERLLQIGTFAVSCSSDQNRILSLRSGLASLEALDPHLVPALMMSPDGHHATLLINSWMHEVQEIRNNVFLIVDPSAFTEKTKQMMHQKLLAILKDDCYKNVDVCAVINVGCMVYDFFHVYDKYEPDALDHHDKLLLLLADLDKVILCVTTVSLSENPVEHHALSTTWASYPLLVVHKSAFTVTGSPGRGLGGWGVRMSVPSRVHAHVSFASITASQKEATVCYFLLSPEHGLNQGPERVVTAADRLHEDTAVLRPSGAHLHCILYRILRAIYTMVTPERFFRLNPMQEPPEFTMSVQKECKIVSNLLSSNDDVVYDVKMPKNNKEVTLDQLLKRLKLLYTLVTRIHSLLHPKENDDQWLGCEGEEEPQMVYKNATHTVVKNSETYVHLPQKPVNNMSRSVFGRTNVRSSTRNFPLSKLTKRLKTKMCSELSFSVQLDQLFSTPGDEKNAACDETVFVNKQLDKVRDSSFSVFYNFSPIRKRPSLRKAVLNRQCRIPVYRDIEVKDDNNMTYDKDDLMDETTSLQITDILNQMNEMTSMLSNSKLSQPKSTNQSVGRNDKETKNVLRINVNNQNTAITKHIWNIPVNGSIVEMPLEDSASNVTQPSNVDTLERIHDLEYVESKLNSLKSQLETSL